MAKNTLNHKTTKLPRIDPATIPEQNLPAALPFHGKAAEDGYFLFSFSAFDREHELFNLGTNGTNNTVDSRWFLDMLECLKTVGSMRICDLKASSFDLHPVDWKKANANPPKDFEQYDYQQLRINKSKGRIIGIKIDSIFYVVWLDPHHNLSDSEGYGKATYYKRPQSEYERLTEQLEALKQENQRLQDENNDYKEVFHNI